MRQLKTWNELTSIQQTLVQHCERMSLVDRMVERCDILTGPYLKHQETLILEKLEKAHYSVDSDNHIEFYF